MSPWEKNVLELNRHNFINIGTTQTDEGKRCMIWRNNTADAHYYRVFQCQTIHTNANITTTPQVSYNTSAAIQVPLYYKQNSYVPKVLCIFMVI